MMKIYINKDKNDIKLNDYIAHCKTSFNDFFEQKENISIKSLSSSMMTIRFENKDNEKKPYFVVYSFYDNSLSIPSGGTIFLDGSKDTGYSLFINDLFWLIENEEFLEMLHNYYEDIKTGNYVNYSYDEEMDDESSSSY